LADRHFAERHLADRHLAEKFDRDILLIDIWPWPRDSWLTNLAAMRHLAKETFYQQKFGIMPRDIGQQKFD
jgi:hypothetical protein